MSETQDRSRYGATAARPHGKAGRETRPASVTIDAHAHTWVDAAAEFAAPHVGDNPVPIAQFSTPQTQELNRRQDADRRPLLRDWKQRLADMDAMGVDIQVVLPSPSQAYYALPLEVAVKAATIVNDGVAALCANKPDRLKPFGSVPLQDGHAAAEELERCMRVRGFKGVQILTNVAGRELSDPSLEPFWAKAEALGAAVLLHPLGFSHPQRLARFYFNNVIGQPLDSTVALHYLIFDGVLERYPNLKIIACHGGGYLGGYSGRIDHAWGARPDARAALPQPPTFYLKKLYVDTVVFTPQQLAALVELFGASHVLMGTDYPFDMAEYDPIGHINSVEGFSAETRAALAGGSAKVLLNL